MRTTNNRRKKSQRQFSLQASELPRQVDVLLFGGDGDHLGEVVTRANPAGRRAVERVFSGRLYRVARG